MTFTPNPSLFYQIDPDGLIWEMRYVVTHFEWEGPERLEGRVIGEKVGTNDQIKFVEVPNDWTTLSDEDIGPITQSEVEAHFFGPKIKAEQDGLAYDEASHPDVLYDEHGKLKP